MFLDISKNTAKYLEKIPQKHVSQIVRKIISLQREPFPQDYRHLSGYSGYYRVDIGEYRVIYKIVDNIVGVVLVGERNDGRVYGDFKKMVS